jgi:hypothetical protein
MLERAGLCLIAATRAIGHPIGVHSPEFWPVWTSFVERNERIDEALRGKNRKNAPPRPPRELRKLDLSGAIEMTPDVKAKLGLTKGRGPDYSATLRDRPALDNGSTVVRILSERGRDESFVEFDDGFGAEPAAPAKVEAPPAAAPASAPVDEARREENDDLAHHETLAHAIKDRLDGLETQYGDRRGDESHGRVLQFALEFLGDKRLAEISARDLRHLEQALTEIPGRAKIPGEHGKTLYARYAYGQRVGIDTLTRISSTTVENTYFGTLNAFLNWAESKTDWTPPAFVFNAKCEKLAEPQQRDAFRNDELMRFFSLPLFTGCASPTHIWRPGTCFAQNGLYWAAVGDRKAAHGRHRSGWRVLVHRHAPGQKGKKKSQREEDPWAEDGKRLSTRSDSEPRRRPRAHRPEDRARGARGDAALSRLARLSPPAERPRNVGALPGHYLSKSWQYVAHTHGFNRDFLTLSSGRHTLAGWYDAMKLPQRIRNRLFGHAAQDVPGNYGPIDLTLDEARAALSTELAIQFDIANILLTAKLKAESGELTRRHRRRRRARLGRHVSRDRRQVSARICRRHRARSRLHNP